MATSYRYRCSRCERIYTTIVKLSSPRKCQVETLNHRYCIGLLEFLGESEEE